MMKKASFYKTAIRVFLIALFTGNYAQAQIKTVIPANDVTQASLSVSTGAFVQLDFNLSTLPANCKVTRCELQVTSERPISRAAQINVFNAGNQGIANWGLKPSNTSNGFVSVFAIREGNRPVPGNATFVLKLKLDHSEPIFADFYVPRGLFNKNQGYAPRLIITYEYDAATKPAAVTDWASTYANYQHTSQSPVALKGAIPSEFEKITIPFPNAGLVQQDITMYRDNIYAVSTTDNTLYSVGLSTYKTSVVSAALPGDKQVSNPAIDPSGRFYHVAASQFEATNLADNQITGLKNTNGNVKNAFTTGPDGSLYFCTDNGIFAYTPFPQNALMWDINLGGRKSAVTLNKEGSVAYVLSYEAPDSAKLIAIDANTGKEIKRANIDIDVSRLSDDSFLSTPMVDDNGYVYLANKILAPNKLYVFSPKLAGLKKNENGQMSAPAGMTVGLATAGAYFIKDNMLFSYNPADAANQTTFICNVQGGSVRSLITDRSNNIYYALRGDGALYYKPSSADSFTKIDIGANFDKNLVMGVDGTLYTGTANGLIGLRPKTYNDDSRLMANETDENPNNLSFVGNKVRIQSNFTFSNYKYLRGITGITFEGKARLDKNADVLLKTGSTGDGVTFSNDFTVEKGATLQVKTGN
ncbi:hypothetical protein [Mucilaginibacter sp.]|uniref:hypothetical protein n=1 Tax=Mucilaginibacter sp. TaxID=1882438 RepID=UPI0032663801